MLLKFEEHKTDLETAMRSRIKVFENAWNRPTMPEEKKGICEKVWDEQKDKYEPVEEKTVKELWALIIQGK